MNQTEILKYLEGQKTTRTITDLIVHCTATKPGAKVNVDVIDGWHKERGFKKQPQSGRICGYHFVVLPDGTIETGRYLSEIGAHVSGQNSRSIGICYVGGLDANGKAADTRTPEQKEALIWLLSRLVVMFPDATIKGHRDYSPDLNGDGIIEPWEYIKECPCFNAAIEYSNISFCAIMTKKDKKEYLEQLVANQGNQAGISIAPLLSAIIADCEDVFTVTVEDNQENTKNVTNPQAEIDAFIDAVNADPLHNIPKVYISGVVISFAQLEINEDEINSTVEMAGGHYVLTLSKTPDSSLIIYTANA